MNYNVPVFFTVKAASRASAIEIVESIIDGHNFESSDEDDPLQWVLIGNEADVEDAPDDDEKCPKCSSTEVEKRHHNGTFAVPECDYKECDKCGHQWGHS